MSFIFEMKEKNAQNSGKLYLINVFWEILCWCRSGKMVYGFWRKRFEYTIKYKSDNL